jgi:hypothetical protein
LVLEDAIVSTKDAAETDLPEAAESETFEESSEGDELVAPEGIPPTE